jgi:hypothetical protein
MRKDANLGSIVCPKCHCPAKEVIYAQQKTRVGWYCSTCYHFEKAIGRERKV